MSGGYYPLGAIQSPQLTVKGVQNQPPLRRRHQNQAIGKVGSAIAVQRQGFIQSIRCFKFKRWIFANAFDDVQYLRSAKPINTSLMSANG